MNNFIKRFLFSPIFVMFIFGLIIGIFFALIIIYDIIPSWKKLPIPPAMPITITNVELGNTIIEMDNGKSYRCTRRIDECWVEDLDLAIVQWGELVLEYTNRTYSECDYTKLYFLTWKPFLDEIIDCKYNNEAFVDWGVTTVVIIDKDGNVWEHSNQWNAMASIGAMQILPLFCGIIGLLFGLIYVVSKKLLSLIHNRHRLNSIPD